MLSPLRFHYKSTGFRLPIRLGMINAKKEQDIVIFLLGESRYKPANYPHVPIPTNLIVKNPVRENFAGFYEGLFAKTLEKNPKAVVTEYVWKVGMMGGGTFGPGVKCDPCPPGMRTISRPSLLSLGLDVLGNDKYDASSTWNQNPKATDLILTRLHGRFQPDAKNPDLVFQKAIPIVGGVGSPDDDKTMNSIRYPRGETNRFQGRYVILHEWEEGLKCEEPRRGIWGFPPRGGHRNIQTAGGANFAGEKPKALKPKKYVEGKIRWSRD